MKVFLVRHGETDWNAENRIQGVYDIPLNEQGLRQAAELSRRLRGERLRRVFSSNLSRSYGTALEIAKPHGLEVERDSRLAEISQGIWEGLLVEEARRMYGERYARFEKDPASCTPPSGESMESGFSRVREFWADSRLGESGGDVVIVGHAAINAVIMCLMERMRENDRGILKIEFDQAMRRRLAEVWKSLPRNADITTLELNGEQAA